MSDIDQELDRHKQMRNQAFALRRKALECFSNSDDDGVKITCKDFLEVIRTLPRVSTDLYCDKTEICCGDLVVFTASIFELLYFAYLKEDRFLEALVCIQKVNTIIKGYYPVEPNSAGKWEEYKELLETINNEYSRLSTRLNEHTENAQQENFIDANFEINEEVVKERKPKVNLDNFKKIQNYNPYLLQCKIGSRITGVASSTPTGASFSIESKYGYIILGIGVLLAITGQWLIGLAVITVFIWLFFKGYVY